MPDPNPELKSWKVGHQSCSFLSVFVFVVAPVLGAGAVLMCNASSQLGLDSTAQLLKVTEGEEKSLAVSLIGA